MIKINEEWSLDSDQYQWILNKHYMGVSREGREPKPQTKQTYHGNLTQACRHLMSESAKDCGNLPEIAQKIDELAETLGQKLRPITEEK